MQTVRRAWICFLVWFLIPGAYSKAQPVLQPDAIDTYRKYDASDLLNRIRELKSDSAAEPTEPVILWLHYYTRIAQYYKADSVGITYVRKLDPQQSHSRAEAEILRLHADALMHIGLIDEAHRQYLRSYKTALEINDTPQIVQAVIGFSKVYLQLNTLKPAEKHAKRALVLAKKNNNQHAIAESYNAYGDLLLYVRDTSGAYPFFEKASRYYLASGNNVGYAKSLMKNATCLSAFKKYKEAEDVLNRVLFTFYNTQEYLLAAQCLIHLGDLNLQSGRIDASMHFYKLGLQAAERIQARELLMKPLYQLAYTHSLRNDFTTAFGYQRRYLEIRDQVLNESIAQQVNSLDAQYQNAQNEERIKNLLVEQRLLADNAALKQKQQISLIIAMGLLIFLLFFVWFTYRQKLSQQEILNKQTEQIHQQEIQELINRKEIETMNAVIETQETERKRIAADLHDHVGSLLASVKLQFKSVQHTVEDTRPELSDKLQTAANMLDHATNDIRRISHNLDSDVLNKFGLAAALGDLCDHLRHASSIDITFSGHYLKNALPNKAEMPLYRCAQELITNAIKHAQATQIEVQLNQLPDMVNLIVSDNGVGFDINKVDLTKSLGWRNMRSRIEHLKGQIHIDSNAHSGTTIIIELPYESYD